jgi:hypothetical protein
MGGALSTSPSQAKVDVLEEIAGSTVKKTKGRATVKFNLDSPQGFLHALNVTVGHPEPSKKFLDKGTIRFTFISQTGTTTERCDVVEPEHSDETDDTQSHAVHAKVGESRLGSSLSRQQVSPEAS